MPSLYGGNISVHNYFSFYFAILIIFFEMTSRQDKNHILWLNVLLEIVE
jgi:hypothetical protein